LFFGAPITAGVQNIAKGMGKLVSKAWGFVPKAYQGVPEGEQFNQKLEKVLKGKKGPKFLTGTFKEITQDR
jgi:hypothetical protein